MKRIDVLKGIEQILVQKAYETGHISHRSDGDWQKQADGSWKPYKGQSNQSAPQAQEDSNTENTEYGEITEEDLNITDVNNINVADFDGEIQKLGGSVKKIIERITDSLGIEDMSSDDLKDLRQKVNDRVKEKKRDVNNKIDRAFNLYDEDAKKMLGVRRDNSKEHGYDGEVRFYADGDYNIKPASDRKEFDKVVQYYLDKAGLEDTSFNHKVAHRYIVGIAQNNGLIGDYYWSKVLYPNGYGSDDENVRKSAVRDMRSIPIVKNVGF